MLLEKYDVRDAVITHGTRLENHEHHFWVVAGGLNYDLTAHQFAGQRPIIGVAAHRFFDSWPAQEARYSPYCVDEDEVLALYRSGVIPF